MSVAYYRGLLAQRARIEGFRQAIHDVVRPDDRVLDVGTGLGTYAFFAAEAGAAEVYAADGDPIVHVAHAVAQANGLDQRVRCLRGWVPEVELPAHPDVVIFEDFPPRLLDARVYLLYRDLHDRVLAPGARAIPRRARLFLAPVRSADVERLVAPFGPDDRAYDLDWRWSRAYVANLPHSVRVAARDLVAPPAAVGDVWFDRAVTADALAGGAQWAVSSAGPVHALVLWFDLELAPDRWLSNAPGADPCSWGHTVLPLDPPLELPSNAHLTASVEAPPGSAGTPGWLGWTAAAGGETRRGHEFASVPAAWDDLLAISPDGCPTLTARGVMEARVLALADGRRSVREIARELCMAYPSLSDAEALLTVAAALRGRTRSAAPDAGRQP